MTTSTNTTIVARHKEEEPATNGKKAVEITSVSGFRCIDRFTPAAGQESLNKAAYFADIYLSNAIFPASSGANSSKLLSGMQQQTRGSKSRQATILAYLR
jgi:hypothetical protein